MKSGRTNRMLLQALLAFSEGRSLPIYIVGRTLEHARHDLMPRFLKLADALGWALTVKASHIVTDGSMEVHFISIGKDKKDEPLGLRFIDHFAHDIP